MKFILTVLILIFSTTVYAQDTAPHPLGAASLRKLVETPQYLELEALYKKSTTSSRQRRMAAILKRLRTEAISATTVDPDGKYDLLVNYTGHDGYIHKLPNVLPHGEGNIKFLDDTAWTIADLIIGWAVRSHLLPFGLPPEVQRDADASMKSGYAATEHEDYRSAISYFEKARTLAPDAADIYYNMALAESRIQGRELRAIVWFGAYLQLDPTSPQAPAIKEQIKQLNIDGLTRVIKLMAEIADQTPDQSLKDLYLERIAELWAKAGDFPLAFQTADSIQGGSTQARSYAEIVGAQARAGDTEAALKTAARILDVYYKSSAQLNIADARLRKGDMDASSNLIGAIEDPFYQALGKKRYAKAQREADNKAGALQTLKEALSISNHVETQKLKNDIQQGISYEQARAGDIAAALKTANSIPAAFDNSLAKQGIARAMSMAGDWDNAKQTMKEALEKAKEVPEDSRRILLSGTAAEQAQIEAHDNSSFKEDLTVTPPLLLMLWSWTNINDTILNEPFFLDLSAYMKALPKDSESNMWEPLEAMAFKTIETSETLKRMLTVQEKQAEAL